VEVRSNLVYSVDAKVILEEPFRPSKEVDDVLYEEDYSTCTVAQHQ
jgi:hypothetical protein